MLWAGSEAPGAHAALADTNGSLSVDFSRCGSGLWFVTGGIHGSFWPEMAKVCTRHLFNGSGCPLFLPWWEECVTRVTRCRHFYTFGTCFLSAFWFSFSTLSMKNATHYGSWAVGCLLSSGVASPALSSLLLQQDFASQPDVGLTVKFTMKKILKFHFLY